MKIYSIIISIVAIIALCFCGYLYWKEGDLRNNLQACQTEKETIAKERDIIAKDKEETNNKLNLAYEQLEKINRTATALNYALNSFIIAGDLKVLSIGTEKAKKVEEAISKLISEEERMVSEEHWKDFKSTRLLNPLFGLVRGLANSIVKDSSNLLPKYQ